MSLSFMLRRHDKNDAESLRRERTKKAQADRRKREQIQADKREREESQRRTIENTIDVSVGGVAEIASAIGELTQSVKELTKVTLETQCKCDECKSTYTGGY
tara:strand:- start:794 stop:1099 length:306 start_codon:yes stop_codon:yes gene_type:complete